MPVWHVIVHVFNVSRAITAPSEEARDTGPLASACQRPYASATMDVGPTDPTPSIHASSRSIARPSGPRETVPAAEPAPDAPELAEEGSVNVATRLDVAERAEVPRHQVGRPEEEAVELVLVEGVGLHAEVVDHRRATVGADPRRVRQTGDVEGGGWWVAHRHRVREAVLDVGVRAAGGEDQRQGQAAQRLPPGDL